ncbi:exodeoxyribonuclease VII large subunit [Porticoccus sp.]|uniref:exodeoxyribonuclease VII large subunit n=1 Tax=Porticoccus sp. TaxID=2024853 RepID=UPI003F6A42ED
MPDTPTTLTVTQLNRRIRQLLETHFPLLWVEGEVSNFSRPGSGHWYFTLKDEKAQVRCAMFANRNALTGFHPENGNHVLARCRVSLYEGRGDFQLIIEHLEEAGYGALQRQFDALKQRLYAEGLFSDSHKRPIPTHPQRLGIVTSPTGAALKDILSVLKRRFPTISVRIYPAQVQGKEAARQIAAAIAAANKDNHCDVLIVGRGGGSIEDLWPFNEEIVARAIYLSQIPIVSAVGHEIDFTISDFVADYRAPTPSAAAEVLSPDGNKLRDQFRGYERLLCETALRRLQSASQRLDSLTRQLRNPAERLKHQEQQLQTLQARLSRTACGQLQYLNTGLLHLRTRLEQAGPGYQIDRLSDHRDLLTHRLKRAINTLLEQKKIRWNNTLQLLNAVSPLNTLERGYAIVTDQQDNILRGVTTVRVGDKVTTRLANGSLACKVDKIFPDSQS